jgi:hypothetical protein
VRTRGPGARRRGCRVGGCPELDPGSVAGWSDGGRWLITHWPCVSAACGGARGGKGDAGCAGPEGLAGLRCGAGLQ